MTEAAYQWLHTHTPTPTNWRQLFMPKAFHEGVFKPIQAPNCPVPGCGCVSGADACHLSPPTPMALIHPTSDLPSRNDSNYSTQCRSLGALKDHLRSAHEKRGFCDVCLDHKKVRASMMSENSPGSIDRAFTHRASALSTSTTMTTPQP